MSKELIHDNDGRANAFRMDPIKVQIIGLDTPDGPEHPLWDERINLPVPESMILSAMAIGIRQTITVTVVDGTPFVVDGRQRVRAARLANERLRSLGEPPLLVTVAGESAKKVAPELLQTTMVALNEIRQADDILIKAAKAGRMLARNIPTAKVAIAFGVTEQCIRDWSLLEGLHEEVREAVRVGQISASAARELADVPLNEQPVELAKLLNAAKESGTKRPTANDVKRNLGKKPVRPKSSLVKKIIEAESDLPKEFILAHRWTRGEINTKQVKGLSALVRDIEEKKAKPREMPENTYENTVEEVEETEETEETEDAEEVEETEGVSE